MIVWAQSSKGVAITTGTVVRCVAKMRELGQCADYDASAASGAIGALDTGKQKLDRLKSARDNVQAQLNRANDAIKNEMGIRAQLDRFKNSDEGKACPKK